MHSRIGCGHIDSSLKKQIELSFQLVFQHNALPETFLIYNFKVPAEIEKEGHPHCDGGRGWAAALDNATSQASYAANTSRCCRPKKNLVRCCYIPILITTPPAPQRNVSMAALRGAVHPSINRCWKRRAC